MTAMLVVFRVDSCFSVEHCAFWHEAVQRHVVWLQLVACVLWEVVSGQQREAPALAVFVSFISPSISFRFGVCLDGEPCSGSQLQGLV